MRMMKVLSVVLLWAGLAGAQASRTWVSGVGDDVNPCSRTAPCKTFAGAISKTAAGGEIDALDPAGYGALTITKAITIDGGGGQVASVLVSGTNGIVVSAGPSDKGHPAQPADQRDRNRAQRRKVRERSAARRGERLHLRLRDQRRR